MDELTAFRDLCRPSGVQELRRLSSRLDTHLDAVEEAGLSDHRLDVALAQNLVAALRSLISAAADLDADQRALLRGAVEYFLLTQDADNDLTSVDGLKDDARVINHVCTELGRDDLQVGPR